APGGTGRGGLAAAVLGGWRGIVLALGSAHVFQSRNRGIPWIALGVGAPTVVGFVTFFLFPQVRRIVESIPQAGLLAVQWPRLGFSQPSTSLVTALPMVLIPAFLVPFWILVHAASLRALLVADGVPEHSAAAGSRGSRGSRGVAPASLSVRSHIR